MSLHINQSGVWTPVQDLKVHSGGAFVPVRKAFVNQGGVWNQYFASPSWPGELHPLFPHYNIILEYAMFWLEDEIVLNSAQGNIGSYDGELASGSVVIDDPKFGKVMSCPGSASALISPFEDAFEPFTINLWIKAVGLPTDRKIYFVQFRNGGYLTYDERNSPWTGEINYLYGGTDSVNMVFDYTDLQNWFMMTIVHDPANGAALLYENTTVVDSYPIHFNEPWFFDIYFGGGYGMLMARLRLFDSALPLETIVELWNNGDGV